MGAAERAIAQADLRARRLLIEMGREIRMARVTRGLSQAVVARAAGISQSQLSRVERGLSASVSTKSFARLSAAVGMELSMKAYPAGQPIRDRAHVALIQRFRDAIGPGWVWLSEVPLPIAGDKRAWDRVMRGHGFAVGIEGETRPTDMQELGRRLALKKRDGGMERVILVLSDTEWCRRLVRLNDLEGAFPVAGKVALRALAAGRDPGGDAIVLI